ncbi:alpha/beta fold hydrolase, partial [Caldimonas tepidiphila]|uniref:alpha/beta fold hydrolase n=1 Tax=Caldimonas tepidiphila TaxID=2315841 RepID=UPI003012C3FD
ITPSGVRGISLSIYLRNKAFGTLSREMMLRPSQLRALAEDAAFMVPAAMKFSRRYRELKMPVTILAGAEDKVVDPQAHAARLHKEIPHSDLHVLPAEGHMLHYAVPEKVVEAVDRVAGAGHESAVSSASF